LNDVIITIAQLDQRVFPQQRMIIAQQLVDDHIQQAITENRRPVSVAGCFFLWLFGDEMKGRNIPSTKLT